MSSLTTELLIKYDFIRGRTSQSRLKGETEWTFSDADKDYIDAWDYILGYDGPSDGSTFGEYSNKIKYYIYDNKTQLDLDVAWVGELEGIDVGTMYSEGMHKDWENYLIDQINLIDSIILPDFERVANPEDAHIEIAYVPNLPGKLAGQYEADISWSTTYDDNNEAINTASFTKSIFSFKERTSTNGYDARNLKDYPALNDITAATITHEFIHAIGLDHPGGDPTSTLTNSNETIMSYNWLPYGPLTPTLKLKDQEALAEIWGKEDAYSFPSQITDGTKVAEVNSSYVSDSKGFASIAGSTPVTVTSYEIGTETTLNSIKDYDGNLHAGDNLAATASSYKYQGMLDVNGDGVFETIFTNKSSKRWVTAKVDSTTGQIDFDDNGAGGGTRVVGIYEDPLIAEAENNNGFLSDGITPGPANFGVSDADRYVVVNGETIDRLALNSQVRFQNDLEIDNLQAKHSGDYDSDGVHEVYWKTNDGTAYLRSLMHVDGNIRYANYQSEQQMTEYLTAQGHEDIIADIV